MPRQSKQERIEIIKSKEKLLTPIAEPVKALTRQELVIKKSKELEDGLITVADFATELRLTDQQREFAVQYASLENLGNGEAAAMIAFNIQPTEQRAVQRARAIAKRLEAHQGVLTLVNALLTSQGWNDSNVRKQHLFLLQQNVDLKMKGIMIKLYYEVNGTLKKDAPISVVNNIDINVYSTDEKKKIRDMLYKGMGRSIPEDEEINFEDIEPGQ
jgi:hypothetical protein